MSDKIQHPDRLKQIIRFDGLQYGSMAPTDIDGYMDWDRANVEIFIEMKHRGAAMPDGQRYAYEKLVRDARTAGRRAYALVCEHEVDDTDKNVYVALSLVREYYDGQQWRKAEADITCKQFTDFIWGKYGK